MSNVSMKTDYAYKISTALSELLWQRLWILPSPIDIADREQLYRVGLTRSDRAMASQLNMPLRRELVTDSVVLFVNTFDYAERAEKCPIRVQPPWVNPSMRGKFFMTINSTELPLFVPPPTYIYSQSGYQIAIESHDNYANQEFNDRVAAIFQVLMENMSLLQAVDRILGKTTATSQLWKNAPALAKGCLLAESYLADDVLSRVVAGQDKAAQVKPEMRALYAPIKVALRTALTQASLAKKPLEGASAPAPYVRYHGYRLRFPHALGQLIASR